MGYYALRENATAWALESVHERFFSVGRGDSKLMLRKRCRCGTRVARLWPIYHERLTTLKFAWVLAESLQLPI
jgi:hypothetical protein